MVARTDRLPVGGKLVHLDQITILTLLGGKFSQVTEFSIIAPLGGKFTMRGKLTQFSTGALLA